MANVMKYKGLHRCAYSECLIDVQRAILREKSSTIHLDHGSCMDGLDMALIVVQNLMDEFRK